MRLINKLAHLTVRITPDRLFVSVSRFDWRLPAAVLLMHGQLRYTRAWST